MNEYQIIVNFWTTTPNPKERVIKVNFPDEMDAGEARNIITEELKKIYAYRTVKVVYWEFDE